jgi:Ca-activated chloride channel family protein
MSEEHKTKYTSKRIDPGAFETSEMLTVRFRYKDPDSDTSRLITRTLVDGDVEFARASEDFRFAAAVAEFGMLLRDCEFKGASTYTHVLEAAKNATGDDDGGYRHEFVRLVEKCRELAKDDGTE